MRLHPPPGLDGVIGVARTFGDPWRAVGFNPRDLVHRPRVRHRLRHRGPSVLTLLLAGLAVFAFARLTSVATRNRRSVASRMLLGVLLLGLGAIVLAFRRSGRRRGYQR